ncbi:hypothetical protein DL546_007344 [Coniochaeta pulveracea]|uniref:Uncharacterized protein n=1 Tax=Coniochaeta pulveracea TaxID=177199 RepID=A0A420YEW2_9PEZI|nr:hypothetical protein DL546_007344 [Coniochaeta pulveracea]
MGSVSSRGLSATAGKTPEKAWTDVQRTAKLSTDSSLNSGHQTLPSMHFIVAVVEYMRLASRTEETAAGANSAAKCNVKPPASKGWPSIGRLKQEYASNQCNVTEKKRMSMHLVSYSVKTYAPAGHPPVTSPSSSGAVFIAHTTLQDVPGSRHLAR